MILGCPNITKYEVYYFRVFHVLFFSLATGPVPYPKITNIFSFSFSESSVLKFHAYRVWGENDDFVFLFTICISNQCWNCRIWASIVKGDPPSAFFRKLHYNKCFAICRAPMVLMNCPRKLFDQ